MHLGTFLSGQYTECIDSIGTVYTEKADVCNSKCHDVSVSDDYCDDDVIVAGCVCTNNQYMDYNNMCVDKDMCPCVDQYEPDSDVTYPPGSVLERTCDTWYDAQSF